MKKILIKRLEKKYKLKKDFIKRISREDFTVIDIFKIKYYLWKGLRKKV